MNKYHRQDDDSYYIIERSITLNDVGQYFFTCIGCHETHDVTIIPDIKIKIDFPLTDTENNQSLMMTQELKILMTRQSSMMM